ncbi:MerR-type-transcriptional regulator [Bifidobacterium minimum]|jgi:MerR family transcriptional regulator/heat shock protein HspR|uniref:MerR-type-transcriptional regulator n=1 Tax=Bifidobacterium minimum TaxID=1693 RepID=A0A087BTB2_9BIFI|nr:helix-turn-helix transcriptional regulator [Bifidobacterium minimum]KFI74262.1 MerR-type-transcriptional regulator [Bifidobacterium minimum]
MMHVDGRIRHAYLEGAVSLIRGDGDLDQLDDAGFDISLPVFAVGQVAAIAGVHPQTLRQYDRLGIVVPRRTQGGARRYSLRDVSRLCDAQRLSQEDSVNLAGILRILDLAEENRQLRRQIRRMRQGPQSTVFASTPEGEIVEVHGETSIGLRREIRERTESYAERSLMIVGQECSTAGSAALVVWKACP